MKGSGSVKWRAMVESIRPPQSCGHRRIERESRLEHRCEKELGHEADHQAGDLRWSDDDSDSVDPPDMPPRSLVLSARDYAHPVAWLESLALAKSLGKGDDIGWLAKHLGVDESDPYEQEVEIMRTPWWWRLCWEYVPVPAESGGGQR